MAEDTDACPRCGSTKRHLRYWPCGSHPLAVGDWHDRPVPSSEGVMHVEFHDDGSLTTTVGPVSSSFEQGLVTALAQQIAPVPSSDTADDTGPLPCPHCAGTGRIVRGEHGDEAFVPLPPPIVVREMPSTEVVAHASRTPGHPGYLYIPPL